MLKLILSSYSHWLELERFFLKFYRALKYLAHLVHGVYKDH